MTVDSIDPAQFTPSEYSAMIVRHLMAESGVARDATVCDIGTGSGILAQTALKLGASHAVATDIDPDALAVARHALADTAPGSRWDLRAGSIWQAIALDETFDLVVANLPNFPGASFRPGNRSPHWASGGADGRQFVDPFLDGLAARLNPGGRAVFTQNRCIGLQRTLDRLAGDGLSASVRDIVLVAMGPEKCAALDPDAARAEGFVRVGRHVFLEVCLIGAEKPRSLLS